MKRDWSKRKAPQQEKVKEYEKQIRNASTEVKMNVGEQHTN